jgi:hypothetical protein
MCRSLCATQVLALPVGLPATLVDEILTATEAALLRHGVARIWLDTSQHEVVVMADLPRAAEPVAESPELRTNRG